METLASKVRELGEKCGMIFLLVDSRGKPFEGELDFEIPDLVLALSKATGSRSSTVLKGTQITAVFLDGLREKCYLVVIGEFREDNAYKLLEHVVLSSEASL